MAEADGQYPTSLGWVPGVDFDPSDEDEMEVMTLVWGKEKADYTRRLERENEELRAQIAQLTDERGSPA